MNGALANGLMTVVLIVVFFTIFVGGWMMVMMSFTTVSNEVKRSKRKRKPSVSEYDPAIYNDWLMLPPLSKPTFMDYYRERTS